MGKALVYDITNIRQNYKKVYILVRCEMVFSSAVFLLLFLPITFGCNYVLDAKYSNWFLLMASLFFYGWAEPVYVLLLFLSVCFNWALGRCIAKGTRPRVKKAVLTLGILGNLSVLGYYKYARFLLSLVGRLLPREVPLPSIALPIGISFFTFQAITFLVDLYKGEIARCPRFVDTALYICFFPQLVSGPILKYDSVARQLSCRSVEWTAVASGFRRFIYGLSKKILLSNVLGLCADTLHGRGIALMDGPAAWIAALAYTFQIYYDFSGYSDMAVGLGQMFGFSLPENFRYPYLSRSVTEFWRRWHITLGAWFREYVYIPLGGNRKGKLRTYLNLSIVFFLTGLWHGASVCFVIWGLYHGFFMVIERLGLKKLLDRSRVLSVVYCFLAVHFGWVFFRANSTLSALRQIARMVLPWRYASSGISPAQVLDFKVLFVGLCAVVGMGFLQLLPQAWKERWKDSAAEAILCVGLLLLCLASVASNTYNPFIYFQF